MTDIERIQDEDVGWLQPPSEVLDHLVDELIDWKDQRGEELEVEWIPEDGVFRVLRGAVSEVDLFTTEIDGDFYTDGEAVVVEAGLGPLEDFDDLPGLLRFAYEEQVYSRLALGEDDILLVQAALPVSHLTPAQLDGMVREVASLATELREEEEEPPAGAA